jgi:hypothetical protein
LKHLLVQLQAVAEVVEHLPDLREGNRKALSPPRSLKFLRFLVVHLSGDWGSP